MQDLIYEKAKELVFLLRERKMTITFAESCTGGLCASSITRVSGASEIFKGSAVTYCDQVKSDLLGVSGATLEKHTVYSGACANEMSAGVQKLFGADMAISLTGIAGPSGATQKDPVGTVYVSLICKDTHFYKRFVFTADRDQVRNLSVISAFEMAISHLQQTSI